jgi:predicted PurR-regulated permease PerM
MPKPSRPKVDKYHLTIKTIPGYFLLLCLFVSFYFLYQILEPFITVLLIAAILATVFYPVYEKILKRMPKHSRLASLISCFLVILIIVAPLTGFTFLLASEAADTYDIVEDRIMSGDFDEHINRFNSGELFGDFAKWVPPIIDLEGIDIKQDIVNTAQSISTFLVEQTATLLKNIGTLVLDFLIMLFSMFYFFKDGKVLLKKLMELSPLPTKYELAILNKFREVSKATIFGIFATAIAQGIVGGIGFMIAGIGHAAFWGTAMALFSLVPLVGTAVIWVPAVIIMFIMGNFFGGFFMLVWGPVAIGSVDNLLRPYLIEGKAKLYPLLTFLAIFGGITVFGLKGVIFGPLILALCMTFLHIYELEYKKVIKH